jgi:hypothetical protein
MFMTSALSMVFGLDNCVDYELILRLDIGRSTIVTAVDPLCSSAFTWCRRSSNRVAL